MSKGNSIRNREELYNQFDRYSADKKEAISQTSLKAGSGLLKTYLLETSSDETQNFVQAFGKIQWNLQPIDEALYFLSDLPRGVSAYLDVLSPRYSALYTTSPSADSDDVVRRAVRD